MSEHGERVCTKLRYPGKVSATICYKIKVVGILILVYYVFHEMKTYGPDTIVLCKIFHIVMTQILTSLS